MKILLAAILCSVPAIAADRAWETAAVRAACGPDDVKFNATTGGLLPAPQLEPGKAMVYVAEQFDSPTGELVTPTVRVGVDGSWVGANYGTSYLYFPVDPGAHHLCADWQSLPPLTHVQMSLTLSLASLTAESGQTYYFRARIVDHSGAGPWTLDLELVNSDEGQLLVAISPASDYRRKK
jgi:hypothetical protein